MTDKDIYREIAKQYRLLKHINQEKINMLKSVIYAIKDMIDDIEKESIYGRLYGKYCYEVGNIPCDEFDENLARALREGRDKKS